MSTWKLLAVASALVATGGAFGATPYDAAGHPTTEAAVAAQQAAVAKQIKDIRRNAELTDTYWVKYYDWNCAGSPR